jgi:hypothetical protein
MNRLTYLIWWIGYIDAIAWIQQQIESDEKYQSDDTRFWVDVQAIQSVTGEGTRTPQAPWLGTLQG